jgi:hypothetical protein
MLAHYLYTLAVMWWRVVVVVVVVVVEGIRWWKG